MLKSFFNVEADETVTDVKLVIEYGWGVALPVLALLVAFAIYLYRSESWLSGGRRLVMGGCYLAAGALLLLLLLKPSVTMETERPKKRSVLVLLDSSMSMQVADKRTEIEDALEAAKTLGKVPSDQEPEEADPEVLKSVETVTRLELAKAALQHPEQGLATSLEGNYTLRYYGMDEALRPLSAESGETGFASAEAEGNASRIGAALAEVVTRHAGQPLAGVVVLSDFAWVEGRDPSAAARKLKAEGVPVYTVPIGLPAPPDVSVPQIIAPNVVFAGDKAPVKARIESTGFDGETVELAFSVNGDVVETREVELSGRAQFEEFSHLPAKDAGELKLAVSVKTDLDESGDANNRASHVLRVLNEKINVLYVEGMPRWEYRYLRWVLMRDPRLRVRFLMTQGDEHLARTSNRHVGAFPSKAEEMLKYDLIILGDVSASYFRPEQLKWLQDLVKTGGGSLLMLAGPMGAPGSYAETQVADMLPVRIAGSRWRSIGSRYHPVVTGDGMESAVTALGDTAETSNRIWSAVRPLGYLPQLDGAKPAATTLLTLSRDENATSVEQPYPLVAWQRYGSGKTMFVGTADLWRLRREVGERFHSQFWSQAIQFLALSRLLGQNKPVTVETGEAVYATGDRVEVFVNALTESFEPVEQESYVVLLEKEGSEDPPVELELSPAKRLKDGELQNSPGSFVGTIPAGEEGRYLLRAKTTDPNLTNSAAFEVENVPVEERKTDSRPDVAAQISAITGGKMISAAAMSELPGLLHSDEKFISQNHRDRDLWDMAALFLVLVVLTGVEWYLRRRENLV